LRGQRERFDNQQFYFLHTCLVKNCFFKKTIRHFRSLISQLLAFNPADSCVTLFFACPKKRVEKKGHPNPSPFFERCLALLVKPSAAQLARSPTAPRAQTVLAYSSVFLWCSARDNGIKKAQIRVRGILHPLNAAETRRLYWMERTLV